MTDDDFHSDFNDHFGRHRFRIITLGFPPDVDFVLHQGDRRAKGPSEVIRGIIDSTPPDKWWRTLEAQGLLWPKWPDPRDPAIPKGDVETTVD